MNKVQTYVLENDYLYVEIINVGATIYKLIDKRFDRDIVLGLNQPELYLDSNDYYFGVTVGPIANRIKGGKYNLNGEEINLEINNNGNCNHSASNGYHNKIFKLQEVSDTKLVLHLNQDDCDLDVVYTLIDNELKINYQLIASKDSVINLTNHSYFNLDGSSNIFNHKLNINADYVSKLDDTGCALDELIEVQDTYFDYRNNQNISIDDKHEQYSKAKGIDHAYHLKDNKVTLSSNEIQLEVTTSYPVALIYTSNWIDGVKGKYNQVYNDYQAVCIECQYPVNDINYNANSKTIVRKGDTYNEFISFKVK